MKAAPFAYERPSTVNAALALMAETNGAAKIMAGGQSLGPMLNLRIARPETIVSILNLADLGGVEETADAVTIGACVTHGTIADRLIPDIGQNVLPQIAENIAYRAVRNRGTIGGSLCHADPAADWLCTLTALDATILTARQDEGRPTRRRGIPLSRFVTGAFRNALESGEIVEAVRVPRLAADARWGYFKACRKAGEFAHAIGVAVRDPARGIARAVIGATGTAPIVIEDAAALFADPDAVAAAIDASPLADDPYERQIHIVALQRALKQAS